MENIGTRPVEAVVVGKEVADAPNFALGMLILGLPIPMGTVERCTLTLETPTVREPITLVDPPNCRDAEVGSRVQIKLVTQMRPGPGTPSPYTEWQLLRVLN
ncbi:MAG: hypothetical protein HY455_03785 [Parcubacteria group bacterium]|nr:hypothetical protein [Parcubacteria group bacterium]